MRDHIVGTVRGLLLDLERLSASIEGSARNEEIIAAALDLADRTSDERQWLRAQPLSSILDDAARSVLNRYRLLVARADVLGEHYLLTMSPDDIDPWMDALVELGGVVQLADTLPE